MRGWPLLLVMPAAATAQPAGETAAEIIARGRSWSDWSSPAAIAALHAAAAPALRAAIDAAGGPAAFSARVVRDAGPEQNTLDEVALALNGRRYYARLAAHARGPALLTALVWEADGSVLAAGVQPAAASPPVAAVPLAARLPFGRPRAGDWLTFWGGDNQARNYHLVARAQARAFDFLVVRDGRSYAGDAADPASYFCWGEPAVAIADGVVVTATDGLPDQPVGAMDAAHPPGNHVIVRHAADRYSLVAHLQRGSVAVKPGQSVRAGDLLGRCGNSGNSSEPHIHVHAQTAPTFAAGGTAVLLAFDGLTPRRGDVLTSIERRPEH